MGRIHILTARQVETLPDGNHADGGNLFLRVRGGSRAWVFRYKTKGVVRELGLGSAAFRSLAQARKLAAEMRLLIANGRDPASALGSDSQSEHTPSFAEMAARVIESKRPGWKNAKHASQWENTLSTYVFPVFGHKKVDEVNVEDVLRALRPIWTEKHETASRVRQRIEAILDAAHAAGWRRGDNPARWRGHLQHLLPSISKKSLVRHMPALPYEELPAFWQELQAKPGMAALALRFLILTAARTGEVLGARWDEIDMSNALWRIPAQRMKAKRSHEVPLSGLALEVLRSTPMVDDCPYLFPGTRGGPMSNMAMLELLRGMRPGLTVHGFRSTFRDWAGDMTHHPREVIEAALAHQLQGVESAYRRKTALEKRRLLMEDWAHYVASSDQSLDCLPAADQ